MWFYNLNRKIKSVVKLLEHRNTLSLYIRCVSNRAQPDQNIHPAPIRAQHSMWVFWRGLDHTLLISNAKLLIYKYTEKKMSKIKLHVNKYLVEKQKEDNCHHNSEY